MNDFTKEERDIVVSTISSSKNISTEIFTKLTRELLEDRTCSNCHSMVAVEDEAFCNGWLYCKTAMDFGCNLWEAKKG